MEIVFSNDKNLYKKLVHNGKYDPFSQNFDRSSNMKLWEEAKLAGAHINTISIIKAGFFLNKVFHQELTRLLKEKIAKLNLSKNEIKEFFMALTNEKELINNEMQKSRLNTLKELTAFDLKNAVEVFNEYPAFPQNYTSRSEMIVDFANLFFKYIANTNLSKGDATEEESFEIIEDIWHLSNIYYGIKAHYDSCLFNYGKIDIINPYQLFFDSTQSGLNLLQRISTTYIEDLKISRLFQCLNYSNTDNLKMRYMTGGSNNILADATLKDGFINYSITTRVPEDFKGYLDAITLITDPYPFFLKQELQHLEKLTLFDLLHLHTEVKLLSSKFYNLGPHKMDEFSIEKLKLLFLPKIKHSVLKSYLSSVTIFNEAQIETFIKLMTVKEGRNFELYYAPLVKEEDYYYFPYFPLLNANYLCLIDYWLEQGKENMKDRGTALQNYVKSELKLISKTKLNHFKLIDKSDFVISDEEQEEIDLVIETKNTLIVAEVKCIKYPLNARGYYTNFNNVVLQVAYEQVLKKADFLINNKNAFEKIIDFNKKTVVKVIILNYSCFTGGSINGVPITDISTFFSYFITNKMKINAMSGNLTETLEEYIYYSDEDEFSNNFNTYLLDPPHVKRTASSFVTEENSFTLGKSINLRFMSINPSSSKSKFVEY